MFIHFAAEIVTCLKRYIALESVQRLHNINVPIFKKILNSKTYYTWRVLVGYEPIIIANIYWVINCVSDIILTTLYAVTHLILLTTMREV